MPIVVDAGAIVAAVDRRDGWHRKAHRIFHELPKPLITCEAVISEASYVLGQSALALDSIMTMFASHTNAIEVSLAK